MWRTRAQTVRTSTVMSMAFDVLTGRRHVKKDGIQITTASPALLGEVRRRFASFEPSRIADARTKGVDGKSVPEFHRAQIKSPEQK
jgi:hypothetical protein